VIGAKGRPSCRLPHGRVGDSQIYFPPKIIRGCTDPGCSLKFIIQRDFSLERFGIPLV